MILTDLSSSVGPVEPEIEGAMRTPDGEWRVEIVRRGKTRWYRIVHGDDVLDWLSISGVERVLAEAGIDMGALDIAA